MPTLARAALSPGTLRYVDEAGGAAADPTCLTILLVSETYRPDANGAAYFVDRLARGLAQRGHDVHVACPRPGHAGATRSGRITVHHVRSWPIPGYPQVRVASPARAARWLRSLVEEILPDIVHVQNHFVLGRGAVAAADAMGVPVVATNHFLPDNFTAFGAWLPAAVRDAIDALLWRDVGRVYRRVLIVTAPTPYAADLTQRRANLAIVRPVSCGVDREAFAPSGAANAFRARYGIPDRPTLLHVGRLDPDKHVGDLIRALSIVRRSHDAQLVVVGRGELRGRLRAQAERLGLDVYCNAGTAELQSIATLEAMAAHRPVLAAAAHALPLLVEDGVNGHLFAAGDVEELARRAGELLEDAGRRRAMGEASRHRVAAHDLTATLDTFETIYREVSCARAATPDRPTARSLSRVLGIAAGVLGAAHADGRLVSRRRLGPRT